VNCISGAFFLNVVLNQQFDGGQFGQGERRIPYMLQAPNEEVES
jgi:hypothetical protein